MPIVGKFFPSQKSQEKVFLLLRRHWFTYFIFIIVAVAMSVPVIILIAEWIVNPDYFSGPIGNVAILGVFAYSLFVLGLMLYGFIDYYLDVYIITNERIVDIEQNGFFKREISELHLHQIQDVSAKVTGFIPTMAHFGDIFIQTAGERENFIFKSIPNPYRVSKLIVDLHEAQLEQTSGPHDEAESEVMQAYNEDLEGKARDMFDLEKVDPAAISLARKRTKEFLKGGSLEETDLRNEVETKLSEMKNEKLLERVNSSKELADKSHKASSEVANPGGSKAPSASPKSKKNGDNEGEMHENEEIDF